MNVIKCNVLGFFLFLLSLVYSFFVFPYSLDREFFLLDTFVSDLWSEKGELVLYLVLHIPFYFSGFYLYKAVLNSVSLKKMGVFLVFLFVVPLINAIAFSGGGVFGIFAFFLAFGYGVSEFNSMVSIYSLYVIFVTFSFVILTNKPITKE